MTALVMATIFIFSPLKPFYGLILIGLYVVSVWWLWHTKAIRVVPHKEAVEVLSDDEKLRKRAPWTTKLALSLKITASMFLVLLSSKISIDSAVALTKHLAMSLETVGVTIFALGTSLPELALSFQAVKKKEYSLAFGNSFGSVLEQSTLILGLLVFGSSKPVDLSMLRPIAPLMFLSYAIVAHSLLKKTKVGRQEGLGRIEGIILVCLFFINIAYFLLFV